MRHTFKLAVDAGHVGERVLFECLECESLRNIVNTMYLKLLQYNHFFVIFDELFLTQENDCQNYNTQTTIFVW